ncbi:MULTISPECIES: UvrD-helicase domain-containing protein [Citrobacter]|uniref:UvrD-helicase domain-containing protein n=1 Tax=Citrobacter TaxID=544 RepID=UPI00397E1F76
MDAIEAARQTAESLHQAAANRGCNLCDLLGYVLNEAELRDVEVYAIPSGDPQLNGARALFDSQARVILYEDVGSSFEKAFLIAHEIGHLELEGSEEDSLTNNTEHDRASESPATSIESVVDYGSHERREVIMDLFARELLLPRYLMRSMHVDEHMSSHDIADKYQAPLNVVQQQLVDALLLPLCKSESNAHSNPVSPVDLDKSQQLAAIHRGSPFLLQAGPGTGKTRTLVHRVESLLEEGVDPGAILILTFSNKAAGELRERISSKHPKAITTLWIGTFHSFGLDIVHRFHDRLGLSEKPALISRDEAIGLLEDELASLDIKHFRNLYDPALDLSDMLSAISRAKDEVIDATEYTALAEAMLSAATDETQTIQAEKCLDVALLYQAYEALLKQRDSIDFGDLVSLPVKLVEEDAEVRRSLSLRHQHILVDEYQDVNRASVRLLKAISGDSKRLWVVGDARQSIYRFRGASSTNMGRFASDFDGATIEKLDTNYRSGGEIVELYRLFSEDMKASEGALPLKLRANRGNLGNHPELRLATTVDDEISLIAGSIEESRLAGVEYKDQAILCTSNNRLSEIAAHLEKLGIPILYLGSVFERDEIKDLLSLLSLVTDRRASGLIRAATIPGYKIDLGDVLTIQNRLREVDCPPQDWMSLTDEDCMVGERSADSLMRLSRIIGEFQPYDAPWAVLMSLVIDHMGWAKKIYQAGDLQSQMKGIAIWQLLNFSRSPIKGTGFPIDRLLSRIRRIVLLSEDREIRQLPQSTQEIDGVRLMTIHASKGLEFKVVHLPGLIAGGLPGSNRSPRCPPPDGLINGSQGMTGLEATKAGHDEEEECKFFVATSRAKDNLVLYASSIQPNGNKRNRSIFIDRIASSLITRKKPPRIQLRLSESEVLTPAKGALSLTDRQISLYERCPRRFLYTHMLSLAGKRSESGFLKMHTAIYEILDWLKHNHSDSSPDMKELEARFRESWLKSGPVDHSYADDYLRIGQRLVQYLIETRQGLKLVKPEVLQLSYPEGTIIVLPDEVTLNKDGTHCVRRIKTGKKGSDEFDRIEYTLLLEAAGRHYGKDFRVQAVHLAGETQEIVTVSTRKQKARLDKAQTAITSISRGFFPANPESRVCPRCPNFFVCGKIPIDDSEKNK